MLFYCFQGSMGFTMELLKRFLYGMHTGYLVCTIYICKILSAVTFPLQSCIWLKSLKVDKKTVGNGTAQPISFLPLSLRNLLILFPPLVFDGVITVCFVKSSRAPGKVCNSEPQKPDLCRRLRKSLVACKSSEERSDHGSYFCGVRSALGCKNGAKGLQTLMGSAWGCL